MTAIPDMLSVPFFVAAGLILYKNSNMISKEKDEDEENLIELENQSGSVSTSSENKSTINQYI